MTQPRVVVLAGPNGAGKTTTAPWILRDALAVHEFVNADTIAQGLSAFDVDAAAIRAGRIMLDRIHELARTRADFAFETTLASRSFAPWIAQLRREGYRIEIVFLWLPSPEMAMARVASRVRSGGHSVPEAVIRRRHERGLQNFLQLYRPLASAWHFLDSSGAIPIRRTIPGETMGGSEIESGRIAEADWIVAAARAATAEAIRQHKLLGDPIAVWCDGKVVNLLSEEIPDSFEEIELTARWKLQIISCLRELSDRKEQERLWLSTGAGGSEVGSFTEAVCCLFDDTGLGNDLKKGTTGLGSEADAALRQLYAQLRSIDRKAGAEAIIEGSAMERVRELAAVALRLVAPDA